MDFAPKHDFQLFESSTDLRRIELESRANPTQKVQRFAELVAIGNIAEKPNMTIQERRERWRAEKLAARRRQLVVFAYVDSRT